MKDWMNWKTPAAVAEQAAQDKGTVDKHGFLRGAITSCARCSYEREDCTCPVGFAPRKRKSA